LTGRFGFTKISKITIAITIIPITKKDVRISQNEIFIAAPPPN
jgi:hypothetical protein